jgi:hypothetical protein
MILVLLEISVIVSYKTVVTLCIVLAVNCHHQGGDSDIINQSRLTCDKSINSLLKSAVSGYQQLGYFF